MAQWQKDWFLVGSLSGAAASVTKTLVNLALYKLGISKIHYVDIAGGFMLGERDGQKPKTWQERGLGTLADTLVGSLFGAGLAYLIAKTPKGYEETKGSLFGAALWTTTLSLGAYLKIDGLTRPKARDMSVMLLSSTLFGTATGYLIRKLARFEQADTVQPLTVAPWRSLPETPARTI